MMLSCYFNHAFASSLDPVLHEKIMMLAVTEAEHQFELETTFFIPPGEGPFPVLLMNHGKERGNPRHQSRDRFLALSREFVKRGYAVVIPMRRGFSQSSGKHKNFGCDLKLAGQAQADDIQAVLIALKKQSWVDADHIVIAGQSYGGLATLAFGTRHIEGVRGLLNFAGGLRIDDSSCNWRAELRAAFSDYGKKTNLPSLWFYGANDSYFDPILVSELIQSYSTSGGHAQLVSFGDFKSDAHSMISSAQSIPIWWPQTAAFLERIGMSTKETVTLANSTHHNKNHYAVIDNIAAVPYVSQAGRSAYQEFLTKSLPRAFAISLNGAWSWAEEGDDPAARALSSCEKRSKKNCQLYALDNDVVWIN
jgi:dienelactone hydrolase